MNMPNCLTKFAFLAAAVTAGASFAAADEFDKKTVVTINEAVQLPNATLQPGTYVVKLFRTDVVNRNTVQFFDKDEKHLITTVVAFPNLRLRPTGQTEFAFWEVPAGKPKALRAWFYPGEEFGQEFAYPKAEAATISAGNSGATVPTSDEQRSEVASTAPAQPSTATPTTEPVAPVEHAATPEPAPAPAATPEPAQAPVEVAQAAPPAPAVTPQEPAAPAPTQSYSSDAQRVNPAPASSDKLPKTASNLPLIGLIGMLSFASAAALNFALNRR